MKAGVAVAALLLNTGDSGMAIYELHSDGLLHG